MRTIEVSIVVIDTLSKRTHRKRVMPQTVICAGGTRVRRKEMGERESY